MDTHSTNEVGESRRTVKRYLTAIRRSNLSKPVQLLLETGMLNRDRSFFDYGCGFGDDIRILTENGYTASGWDPYYAYSSEKIPADVVNLGFVLNVIEDPVERKDVLEQAFELCSSVLCVAVIYSVGSNRPSGRSFRDGMLTQKQTFQRYYERDELEHLLRSELTDSVITVAPGITFVFREEEAFRRFRYQRVHRQSVTQRTPSIPFVAKNDRVAQLATDFPNEWNEYVAFLDERGRPPLAVESNFLEIARTRRLSDRHVYSWASTHMDLERIEQAAQQTKDDLIVFLAMSLFEKRVSMSDLDTTAKSDVKYFFGSFSNALSQARDSLLQVGDIDLLRKTSLSSPIGIVKDDGLFIVPKELGSLPLMVRLYIMLGTIFFGSVEAADIIKVHVNSNKLTFFVKSEEEEEEEPGIYDAFKVDFTRRSVAVYHASDDPRFERL